MCLFLFINPLSPIHVYTLYFHSKMEEVAHSCMVSTVLLSPAIDCGDPGTPTNGQHNFSNTTYNSVVTYTCDVGYGIQGSQNRTCQSNGHWDGSVPQCLCKLAISLHCMHVSVFTGTPSNTALCSSPCQNGGTCIGVDTCTCVTGWIGMLCETGKGVTCKNCIKQFLFVVYPT